ncbi:MAG: DUF4337 family protein [Dehalococcoidia bacterium]
MAEEQEVPLEDLQEKIKERVEEDEERGKLSRSRFVKLLAASTAVFAILAAIASLAAGSYANEALFKANEAAIRQTRASDTWAEYQADGIKRITYANSALTLQQGGASSQQVQDAQNNAKREGDKQPALMKTAQGLENEAKAREDESVAQLDHHHRLSYSVTLFQVAIGLAALAALVNIQPLWWGSLLTGLAGLIVLLYGFLASVHSVNTPEQSPQGTGAVGSPRAAVGRDTTAETSMILTSKWAGYQSTEDSRSR